MRSQDDRRTEMDHRIACELLIPRHSHQSALERGTCATTGSVLACATTGSAGNVDGTADVLGIGLTQELRMIQAEQISSFPHVGGHGRCLSSWKTLKPWRRRHRSVAAKQRWCLRCNVSMWHWLKRGLRSWHGWLRSACQRNTDVLSSLHRLIGIGEIRPLCAAGRVT